MGLGLCSWLALASPLSLTLNCGSDGTQVDGTQVDGDDGNPPPVTMVPWLDPAPELRIVTSPDGMRLIGTRSALQPGASVHVVNARSGESADGAVKEGGSVNLLVPGGSQDDYEATLRKPTGEQQEAVLTLPVPSLEETEAALGPCNCAQVSFPSGSRDGTVHQPLECSPGYWGDLGCYPQLDAWQAELCALPGAGAILRLEGCGLVQFDFALGSDGGGAFGNLGGAFRSFDAASHELVGFYSYSDEDIGSCELSHEAGWNHSYRVYGRALPSSGYKDCAEVSTCVVCGAEAGVNIRACGE